MRNFSMYFAMNQYVIRKYPRSMKKPASVSVFSVLLIFLVLGTSGCKGLRNLTGRNNQERSWQTMLRKAETDRIKYETMSMSGKVNIHMPEGAMGDLSASYQIFLKKDSLILIRIRKVIEVARVLITPDSIFIRDNINRTLMVSDYSLAEQQTGFEADIQLLQDLLIGNFHPIPETLTGEPMDSETVQSFKGTKAGTDFTYDITLPNLKLTRIETNNPTKNQHTEILYKDFEEGGGTLIPQATKINVSAPEILSLDFQHKKVETNPSRASFKFSVPGSYERIQIN